MKRLMAFAALAVLLLVPAFGNAHDYEHGELVIKHPWARFTPPGAPNGAAYLVIENTGHEPERLLGASSPRAGKVELHETRKEGELMTMRPVGAVVIEPGNAVAFEPGGLHIMLLGLEAPLVEGQHFPMTLRFEHAGEARIEVAVERGGPMKPGMHEGHMKGEHMDGGHMGEPGEHGEHHHGME